MKISEVMCNSHLMSMLLQPRDFCSAVRSYKATSPDMEHEGMNGYMEVHVEFDIKDLGLFTALYNLSRVYPSDQSKWYHTIAGWDIREAK